jgi:hypothetical protein
MMTALRLLGNVYRQMTAYMQQSPTCGMLMPHATVVHDFSKDFPLSGVRTGWTTEHDSKRRELYRNARTHFSISNNTVGDLTGTYPDSTAGSVPVGLSWRGTDAEGREQEGPHRSPTAPSQSVPI